MKLSEAEKQLDILVKKAGDDAKLKRAEICGDILLR